MKLFLKIQEVKNMASVQLKNIHWIGVRNPELRVFDIIMETKKEPHIMHTL